MKLKRSTTLIKALQWDRFIEILESLLILTKDAFWLHKSLKRLLSNPTSK